MTEAEWLTCDHDPQPMLFFLQGQASDRKLGLFAVACCRRIQRLMPDPRSRTAMDVAERFADGNASESERRAASDARLGAPHDRTGRALLPDAYVAATETPSSTAAAVRMQSRPTKRQEAWLGEREAQVQLFRDIFGNPFRPVSIEQRWRTSTAVALAEAAYADRAFDRLPILADALEDAGCDNPDLLGHLRGDGPHVRGCWALDLVLDKR